MFFKLKKYYFKNDVLIIRIFPREMIFAIYWKKLQCKIFKNFFKIFEQISVKPSFLVRKSLIKIWEKIPSQIIFNRIFLDTHGKKSLHKFGGKSWGIFVGIYFKKLRQYIGIGYMYF